MRRHQRPFCAVFLRFYRFRVHPTYYLLHPWPFSCLFLLLLFLLLSFSWGAFDVVTSSALALTTSVSASSCIFGCTSSFSSSFSSSEDVSSPKAAGSKSCTSRQRFRHQPPRRHSRRESTPHEGSVVAAWNSCPREDSRGQDECELNGLVASVLDGSCLGCGG